MNKRKNEEWRHEIEEIRGKERACRECESRERVSEKQKESKMQNEK